MEARRIAQPPPWRGDVAAHERSSLARRARCDGSPAARSARAARRWRRKLDSSAACRAAARAQRRAAAVQAPLHRAGRAVARALRPPHSAARDDGHDSAGTRTQPAGFERKLVFARAGKNRIKTKIPSIQGYGRGTDSPFSGASERLDGVKLPFLHLRGLAAPDDRHGFARVYLVRSDGVP